MVAWVSMGLAPEVVAIEDKGGMEEIRKDHDKLKVFVITKNNGFILSPRRPPHMRVQQARSSKQKIIAAGRVDELRIWMESTRLCSSMMALCRMRM